MRTATILASLAILGAALVIAPAPTQAIGGLCPSNMTPTTPEYGDAGTSCDASDSCVNPGPTFSLTPPFTGSFQGHLPGTIDAFDNYGLSYPTTYAGTITVTLARSTQAVQNNLDLRMWKADCTHYVTGTKTTVGANIVYTFSAAQAYSLGKSVIQVWRAPAGSTLAVADPLEPAPMHPSCSGSCNAYTVTVNLA